jgi:hypothetical protein
MCHSCKHNGKGQGMWLLLLWCHQEGARAVRCLLHGLTSQGPEVGEGGWGVAPHTGRQPCTQDASRSGRQALLRRSPRPAQATSGPCPPARLQGRSPEASYLPPPIAPPRRSACRLGDDRGPGAGGRVERKGGARHVGAVARAAEGRVPSPLGPATGAPQTWARGTCMGARSRPP